MPDRRSSTLPAFPPEEARRLVQRIADLPTLPIVIPRILRLVDDQRSSARDLANVIGSDQSLASRVLRLANSAFFGFQRRVGTLNHAVVLLGFNTVKSLVLAATVFDALQDGDGAHGFDRKQFWLHVVATATAARMAARDLSLADPEVAFVGGLLHDIGKVVLDRFLHQRYTEAVGLAGDLRCPIRTAEVALFGIDHAEVGRWLAERWRLPVAIVESIAFHHRPGAAQPTQWTLSAMVHLADVLARNVGIGSAGDDLIPLPDPDVLTRLRVGSQRLLQWTEALTVERQAVEVFFQELH